MSQLELPVRDVDPTSPSPGAVTLYQAAERLGVHYMTVYRYVRTGRLPGRKVGVEWRVDPADLDAFAAALAAPSGTPSEPGSASAATPERVDYPRRLVDRLVVGDEPGSWAIVQDALTAGTDPDEIHLDVIAPAMVIIGDEWAAGRLSVAQEHQASGVALRLVGRLGPLFNRRGRKRGSVVLGAPAGDRHSLPSALFADLLRGEGFRVIDLGANTPASSFADSARQAERLVAVAITATSSGDDAAIVEAVAAVRAELDVPILLGGRAIRSLAEARALGADRWAGDTRAGLDLLAALADDASRTRRHRTAPHHPPTPDPDTPPEAP